MAIKSFRRIEKKFLVSREQRDILIECLKEHNMCFDKFCKDGGTYKVRSIYYDTDDDVLIRKSIAKPVYKQKLRTRKYEGQESVYLELKKKFDGVVGKRRLELSQQEADDLINNGVYPQRDTYIDKQVLREIEYFLSCYKVKPKVLISYDRLGFFDKDDKEFRITFDHNIQTARKNLDWDNKEFEKSLIGDDQYLMEIKSVVNFPLWLVECLSKNKIYKHSFSKYGTDFRMEGDN